jgi:hypothetical protein
MLSPIAGLTTTPPGYKFSRRALVYLKISMSCRHSKARILTVHSTRSLIMNQRALPTSLMLVSTAINAALYAGVGALWTAFPLTAFGVRFWPQVFVPAAFAVLFGPWSGGVGAAIGIFLADVIYGHHDALLSLLVGVPSNFLGFFIIGWLTRSDHHGITRRVLLMVSLVIPIVLAGYGAFSLSGTGFTSPQFLVALIGLVCVLCILGFALLQNRWADFEVASSIGLGVGSIVIGAGIVLYSYIFALPAVLGLGSNGLPVTFMYSATAFTYLSEIPFLVLLTPPVIAACRTAFPSLGLKPRG